MVVRLGGCFRQVWLSSSVGGSFHKALFFFFTRVRRNLEESNKPPRPSKQRDTKRGSGALERDWEAKSQPYFLLKEARERSQFQGERETFPISSPSPNAVKATHPPTKLLTFGGGSKTWGDYIGATFPSNYIFQFLECNSTTQEDMWPIIFEYTIWKVLETLSSRQVRVLNNCIKAQVCVSVYVYLQAHCMCLELKIILVISVLPQCHVLINWW